MRSCNCLRAAGRPGSSTPGSLLPVPSSSLVARQSARWLKGRRRPSIRAAASDSTGRRGGASGGAAADGARIELPILKAAAGERCSPPALPPLHNTAARKPVFAQLSRTCTHALPSPAHRARPSALQPTPLLSWAACLPEPWASICGKVGATPAGQLALGSTPKAQLLSADAAARQAAPSRRTPAMHSRLPPSAQSYHSSVWPP